MGLFCFILFLFILRVAYLSAGIPFKLITSGCWGFYPRSTVCMRCTRSPNENSQIDITKYTLYFLKSWQWWALRVFASLFNITNVLERSRKTIYRFSSQNGTLFETTNGSYLSIFIHWFKTVRSEKCLLIFFSINSILLRSVWTGQVVDR